jgi:hypothetical protein
VVNAGAASLAAALGEQKTMDGEHSRLAPISVP